MTKQGQPALASVDQRGDGESAAGRLARQDDVRRGDAVLQQSFIRRKGILNRGRIRMLRGEPVVDREDGGVRPPADLRGQAGGEERVPHHVHAAVEVEDDVASFDAVDGDLGGGNPTQCGCGHGDLRRQWLRGEQLSEQPPLLVDIASRGDRRLAQDGVEGLSLFDAH
jgi:hypothetical protein